MTTQESRPQFRARVLFVFVTCAILVLLAHAAAELLGYLDLKNAAKSLPHHTVLYYRAVVTIWLCTALLTPALCFYISRRRGIPKAYWLGFWTCSYLVFLIHLFWTIGVMFHWDLNLVFHSHAGEVTDPEHIVENPGPDLVFALWWGIDVLLAWTVDWTAKWARFQRSVLHVVAFAMFFGATVLAGKASTVAHVLGFGMAAAVTAALVIRLVVKESDPRSLFTQTYVKLFQLLNVFAPWHVLPTPLAVMNLGALREVLRAKNLHSTTDIPVSRPAGVRSIPPPNAAYLYRRSDDGFYNDLSKVQMGSASQNPANQRSSSDFTLSCPGARFGRNIPLSEVGPLPSEAILEPNPRLISNRLLARVEGKVVPARTLNLLAAAWVQFQTHDWFNHGTPVPGSEFEVPLPDKDSWESNPLKIRKTRPDPTRCDPSGPYPVTGPADGRKPATFTNAESHWWDGSEIYGSSPEAVMALRDKQGGGRLTIGPNGLPVDRAGVEQTGLTANWWLGLSLLHHLFALEHNAICGRLALTYPSWSDEELYRVARLVNSALMAKIHTVDWTPAILGHPALEVGMNANWWGIAGERIKKQLGRISDSETVSGIPGSEANHHGADFSLTEEFVSVYRMHPLLPDGIDLYTALADSPHHSFTMGSARDDDPDDVVGPLAHQRALRHGSMMDLMYSFGIACPGALVLRNFPNWMRRLKRRSNNLPDETIDLAAIDIVRDRERGVPRYNRFRRLFHLPPFRSIDHMISRSSQLGNDPQLATELKRIYKDDIEQVDLMVGMYSETPPEGFGFSDTAFRVFVLMASRRLKSDRFLTNDYTPTVYTQVGLDWIENNNMITVLVRHYPGLAPALENASNAFAPWPRVSARLAGLGHITPGDS